MVCTTYVHDPLGRMVGLARDTLPKLQVVFEKIIIAKTQNTDPRYQKLNKADQIQFVDGGPFGVAKKNALVAGVRVSSDSFLSIDFDRLLHWSRADFKELKKVSTLKPESLVILGRTATAISTFPAFWQQTEVVVNALANKIFATPDWDWMTTTFVLNRSAAEKCISLPANDGVSVAFDWPMTIKNGKSNIKYMVCEGFSWEDPDRYQPEIKKESFETWRQKYCDNRHEWLKRIQILNESVASLLHHFPGHPF